jgi:hypothetical protein
MITIICCVMFCTVLLKTGIGSFAIQKVTTECCQNMCNTSVPIKNPQKESRQTTLVALMAHHTPNLTVHCGFSDTTDGGCGHPTPQTPRGGEMGGKINILNEKRKKNFLCSTNFKLLSQMKGNSINKCDFLKSIHSVEAAIVSTCPGRQKSTAMLLCELSYKYRC